LISSLKPSLRMWKGMRRRIPKVGLPSSAQDMACWLLYRALSPFHCSLH
jgi:hypothetical protein